MGFFYPGYKVPFPPSDDIIIIMDTFLLQGSKLRIQGWYQWFPSQSVLTSLNLFGKKSIKGINDQSARQSTLTQVLCVESSVSEVTLN